MSTSLSKSLINLLSYSVVFINPFAPNAPFLPYSFLMFSGGREKVHWEQMSLRNEFMIDVYQRSFSENLQTSTIF